MIRNAKTCTVIGNVFLFVVFILSILDFLS